MIATPAYTGCTAGYINSLLATKDALQSDGHKVKPFIMPGVAIISMARNEIGRYFQLSGYEYIFSVDSDLTWNIETIRRMLAYIRKTKPDGTKPEFVCAVQPIRHLFLDEIERAAKNGDPNAVKLGRRYSARMLGEAEGTGRMEINSDGFGKIDAAGVAFALIHRNVFDKLSKTHPQLRYRAPDKTAGYALFDPFVRDEFAYAEDMAFCRRYRDLGGDIELLVDAPLVHQGPYLVTGNFVDQLLMKKEAA